MQSWLARTQPYVDHQRLRDLSRTATKAPPMCFQGARAASVHATVHLQGRGCSVLSFNKHVHYATQVLQGALSPELEERAVAPKQCSNQLNQTNRAHLHRAQPCLALD